MTFIDLSHEFYQGMPGFRMHHPETGEITEYSAKIYPFLTREETAPYFTDNVSFEITQVEFQSSLGTYIDSPFHRFPSRADISELSLDQVIGDGIVIDCSFAEPEQEIALSDLPYLSEVMNCNSGISQKVLLFNFGYDRYWGGEEYYKQPYISEEVIETLVDHRIKLVGVDTINIDGTKVKHRPAHTRFLDNDIPIVENLRGLHNLLGRRFRFFALPVRMRGAAALPVRAIAELLD